MSRFRAAATRRLAAALVAFVGVFSAEKAQSQTVDYTVTNLGQVSGSYLTWGVGMNDHGTVVGTALFIPGGLKAWTWTAGQGYALLPAPPTITDYAAVDINDSGVVAGDGGGDSGEVWRYANGAYQMLGVLSGTPIPRTAAINASGDITGSCYGTLFYTPRHSFLAVPGSPMVNALSDSEAGDINDAGQITGGKGNVAYRITPGVGVEFLPPLGARILTGGYAINNAGKVVGVAASTAEHTGVPYLFSDAEGMMEIGNFGGRAYASDVNDLDEVVGNWEPFSGVHRPWVWSRHQGVRFLNDIIDPALNLRVRTAYAVNNAGQVLCDARDQNADIVPLLLTPITYCQPDIGFGGPGATTLSLCGQSLINGGSADLRLDSDQPGALALLGFGLTFNPNPLRGGMVVPTPLLGSAWAVTDANGDVIIPGLSASAGPFVLYLQGFVVDPAQPGGLQFSNAVEAHIFP